MFSKFIQSAAIALTLSASFLSNNAAAAPWTFTTTGTIQNGYDAQGTFRTRDSDLSGLSWTMTTIVDPLLYSERQNGAMYGYQSNYGTNPGSITQKITVGGVTKTYNASDWAYYSGQSYMHDTSGFEQAYQANYFSNTNGYVQAYSSVYSYYSNFLNGHDFAQRVAYTPNSGDYGYSYFYSANGAGSTYFHGGTPTSISISAVPEPTPIALFGLGLIALAFVRRKSA